MHCRVKKIIFVADLSFNYYRNILQGLQYGKSSKMLLKQNKIQSPVETLHINKSLCVFQDSNSFFISLSKNQTANRNVNFRISVVLKVSPFPALSSTHLLKPLRIQRLQFIAYKSIKKSNSKMGYKFLKLSNSKRIFISCFNFRQMKQTFNGVTKIELIDIQKLNLR